VRACVRVCVCVRVCILEEIKRDLINIMTFITSSFVHKNDVHSSDKFATMFAYNYKVL